MIRGISHITLSVRDLAVSFAFYADIVGLRPVARWYKGAYLEAGTDWICLSVDPETRTGPLGEYTHLAFAVDPADFAAAVENVRSAGARCWQENRSPGESFYFLDPDGHKLELHVSGLDERLQALRDSSPRELVLFPR